jgi:hypothetical protein
MQCSTNDPISQVIYTPAVCCLLYYRDDLFVSLRHMAHHQFTIHHLVVAQHTAPHRTALTFANKPCPCHLSPALVSLAMIILVSLFPPLASSISLLLPNLSPLAVACAPHLRHAFPVRSDSSSTKVLRASHQFLMRHHLT